MNEPLPVRNGVIKSVPALDGWYRVAVVTEVANEIRSEESVVKMSEQGLGWHSLVVNPLYDEEEVIAYLAEKYNLTDETGE